MARFFGGLLSGAAIGWAWARLRPGPGVFVGTVLRVAVAARQRGLSGDEVEYAQMAQDIVGAAPGGYPLVEPVLFPTLWAGIQRVVPDWERSGRLLALASSSASLALLSPLSKEIFGDESAGRRAAGFLATCPVLIDLGTRPMTEALYHFLLLAAAWPAWTALSDAARGSAHLGRSAVNAGLALGVSSTARREGVLVAWCYAGGLLTSAWRAAGPSRALGAAALCLGSATAVKAASRMIVRADRVSPAFTLEGRTLGRVMLRILAPMLGPAAIILATPRAPGDGLRATLFASFMAPSMMGVAFPDPARKATAAVPFAALLAGEAARRIDSRFLTVALWGWHLALTARPTLTTDSRSVQASSSDGG